MALTCQNVIDRAKQFSPLNTSLATDPTELVTRIQQLQQRIFTAVASLPTTILARSPFTQLDALPSTAAASARVVDLTVATKPVERIVRVLLANGTEVLPVLEFDVYTQLAPRYFVRAKTLVEVGSDWSASASAQTLSVLYAFGATPITPTGGTAQPLSIPDEWADLAIKPLAMYFHTKDPGRDPNEYIALEQEYTSVWNGFLAFLTNYAGVFDLQTAGASLPAPPEARRVSPTVGAAT